MAEGNKKAIIVGATGLIGSELLDLLLRNAEYKEVLSIVRRKMSVEHPKLSQLVINFDDLSEYSDVIKGHAVFCCLGTTKKQTPDTKMYYKIDHDYPVLLAEIAAKNGMSQYHYVSSPGADPKSSIFYTRTKGVSETDLKKVALPALFLYQPSLLTGRIKDKRIVETIAEGIMKVINPLLLGSLKKYRSIAGKVVAKAMLKESLSDKKGTFILTSDEIQKIADFK